ncbi:23S ribosomal RNA methyltransferase Erm [Leucobacter allii]|uniref:23S ribosomal RNA methyltransferase Erm n=1 Tax=Leucobacter allii TaxID=2932247 RepID=A0ABY4FNM8_9MICO|nr:23S ribosomal RNA methyltransferase Erm [Leucobacter allii]UOQ57887.1 23S ribosomal RNA methyltransferase Erm [Leucobacter allii]UOR02527.1 23S ribosomal RNA methyltransferase Erm [Leucobacter allii]
MPRSTHGGRHELGQNFLIHRSTIETITALVAETRGPILELGAGDGALTGPLARLGRPLTAIELDEHRAARLRRAYPRVEVAQGDALRVPLTAPAVVGNIPFHLTTPILRRLLSAGDWRHAVLLTQWEVARKRCGVGGGTLLTAQTAPWFAFSLHGRVPAGGFRPRPGVDGGVMRVSRRSRPLVPARQRAAYERFVRAVFTGPGGRLERIVGRAARTGGRSAARALARAEVPPGALPRDLGPEQWAALWSALPDC